MAASTLVKGCRGIDVESMVRVRGGCGGLGSSGAKLMVAPPSIPMSPVIS